MKIEEYRRDMRTYTIEGKVMILNGIFLMLALIAGCIHTVFEFKPNAETFMSQQAEMQSRLDEMQQDLTAVSEAVEEWQGVAP